MAKKEAPKKKAPKERRNAAYTALAARFFRRQAKQLAKQLDGVRAATDIEFIHRARVASRRLRAGLRVFENALRPLGVKPRKWREAIRQVTASLGAARDRDVQGDLVCHVLAAADEPGVCSGLARILVRIEEQREALQPEVAAAVERLERSGVLAEMQQAANTVLPKGEMKVKLGNKRLLQHGREHILKRLEKLLADQACLEDPTAIERHHAMRIVAKRLRYTLEIFEPVYGAPLRPFVNRVKNVQSHLGEMHDCDVWQADLERFLEQERQRTRVCFVQAQPFARLSEGVEYLRRDRRRHRDAQFAALQSYWQEACCGATWEALRQLVTSPKKFAEVGMLEWGGEEAAAPPALPPASAGNGRDSRAAGTDDQEADGGPPAPSASQPSGDAEAEKAPSREGAPLAGQP